MWQKLRVLDPVQVFVVSVLSATPIAISVALASIPADGTTMTRFLGLSRQFDPLILGVCASVSVILILLGFYHRDWVGALIGSALSAVAWFVLHIGAVLVFTFGLRNHSGSLQQAVYVVLCFLLIVLIFALHTKVAASSAIRDAERSLQNPS